jgi:hypothetical protein
METTIECVSAADYFKNLQSATSKTIYQNISPTAKATVALIGRLNNNYYVAKNYFAFCSFLTCCSFHDKYNKKGKNLGTIYEIFKYSNKNKAIQKLETIMSEYK